MESVGPRSIALATCRARGVSRRSSKGALTPTRAVVIAVVIRDKRYAMRTHTSEKWLLAEIDEYRRRTAEVETGIEPVCTALQAVASPLGHSTAGVAATAPFERMTGFEPATLTLAR